MRSHGKSEDVREKSGGCEALGLQVRDLKRRFENREGALSPKEGSKGREEDPDPGRDPGKEKEE